MSSDYWLPRDYPFRSVFLDTNIVRYLATLPSHFFDGGVDYLDAQKLAAISSGKLLDDIDILQALPQLFRRGVPHDLVITSEVVLELPAESRWYGWEFLDWCRQMGWVPEYVPSEFLSSVATVLDPADRRLFLQAVTLRCDAFLTTDYRTIVRRRGLLREFDTRVITPRQWWQGMKPWAGLFL